MTSASRNSGPEATRTSGPEAVGTSGSEQVGTSGPEATGTGPDHPAVLRPVPPEDLLAFADLILWMARYFRPARRGEGAASPMERSDPTSLEDLCHRTGLSEQGWSGAALASLEERLAPVAGAEIARLFEGAAPCPPNETAYVRRDKGWILADLEGFYRAFGFRMSERSAEKGDHLVSEMEFLAVLLVMLARASAEVGPETDPAAPADSAERAEITGQALASFAGDHLSEWLTPFCVRLAVTAGLAYQELATLLHASWVLLGERAGLTVGDDGAGTPPEIDSGTPYECGMVEPPEPPG